MSSSSSPLTSSSATLIPFSGSSSYAGDFQTVLNKAVTAASQPMDALQADVTSLQSQQSALASLASPLDALQTALANVSSAVAGTPTVSTGGSPAITATADPTALTGTYTIQVNDLGSATTTMSLDTLPTVADPTTDNISSSTQFTLTVNSTNYTITPTGTSLDDLVSAINSSGDGVQATIVNVGSNSSPNYQLAVTSNNLGPDSIQLSDGTGNPLLSTLSTGTDAQYTVNGQSTPISSNSDQVTLSPGLTVQLNQQTSSPVTVTVSQSDSGLQSALSSLATAYNSAVSALSGDRGQNGGALTGDQIIYQITDMLQSLSTYTNGTGPVSSLGDLGLTLSNSGQMSFDASSLSTDTDAVQQFLGTTTTSGFLQTANNDLQTMTDPTTGLLQAQDTTLQTQVTSDNTQIAQQQTMITNLQNNLTQQLSAADAAIATLQAQTSYFQQLFTATYGNGTSSSS